MRWLFRLLIVASACPLAAFGVYAGYLAANGNFATVAPGEVYRSAQPDAAALQAFAARQGRGSVINLRGPAPNQAWYKNELNASEAAGLAHYDFAMSADKELSPAEARRLIALIGAAPKPVLLHCRSGADRTGLAAALYLYASGEPGRAGRQLSLSYGHFPYFWSRTGAMDASLAAYLGETALVAARSDAPSTR